MPNCLKEIWLFIVCVLSSPITVTLLTTGALLFAFITWRKQKKRDDCAMFNSLFEEIHHNLNLVCVFFNNKTLEEILKDQSDYIKKRLENLTNLSIYPNPTDSVEDQKELLNQSFIKNTPNFSLQTGVSLIPLRVNAIEKSLSSGTIANVKPKRIFLNLGHLHYSLLRINHIIRNYNDSFVGQFVIDNTEKAIALENLKNEYFLWLHYRLMFIFFDMGINTEKNVLIDKNFIKTIKKYVQ